MEGIYNSGMHPIVYYTTRSEEKRVVRSLHLCRIQDEHDKYLKKLGYVPKDKDKRIQNH